jgi:hypothetical protein
MIPGPSYSNTKNISRIERWLRLTGRPHSIRGNSKYRGVRINYQPPYKTKWQAVLQFDGRTYHGGSFDTEEEAALRWNALALKVIGPEAAARLNQVTTPDMHGQDPSI